jgi:TIR domain
MKLLDEIAISHKDGTKRIQIFHGDLSEIPEEHAVDLLIVSAWPDNYEPVEGTLIAALEKKGVSVRQLADNKSEDLRNISACWMSQPIRSDQPGIRFDRILCFEPHTRGNPSEVIGEIFQALVPFLGDGESMKDVAMPMVATGQQNVPLADILIPLIDATVHWMNLGIPIGTLKIVQHSELKAAELKGAFSILKRQLATNGWQPTPGFKYDLFVSYSHRDTEQVLEIIRQLQSMRPNLRIFLDREELNTGMAWQQELYDALDDCDKVVAVYSPGYISSKVCKEEFNIAIFRHRDSEEGVLIPIFLRDADLPTYMKLIQFIDFRDTDNKGYSAACEKLLSSLRK